MAKKTKTVRVSEEELALLKAAREGRLAVAKRGTDADGSDTLTATPKPTEAQQALADAFVSAIERTRPPEKKTPFNRKRNTPWTPPDGVAKIKFKRHMFHHGIEISPERVSNEEAELLNKVRPGHYCEGFVRVTVRKDRGIDIDYPVKTASQRLKLVNQFGVRSFAELLTRLIDEKANPKKYRKADDDDLYDDE